MEAMSDTTLNQALSKNDRVCLSGGYDMEPRWLQGQAQRMGKISRFIPGQNDTPAMVVELDSPISIDGITGKILVLELRYVGAKWGATNVVHIELCDFQPEEKQWQHRRQGKWIESHATCARIGGPGQT